MINLEKLKKQCSVTDLENFNQYYTELVNLIGVNFLKNYMPCDINILRKQYQHGNIHFNSNGDNQPYSLCKWDLQAYSLPIINASLSQKVCILKQAAKIICEQYQNNVINKI